MFPLFLNSAPTLLAIIILFQIAGLFAILYGGKKTQTICLALLLVWYMAFTALIVCKSKQSQKILAEQSK